MPAENTIEFEVQVLIVSNFLTKRGPQWSLPPPMHKNLVTPLIMLLLSFLHVHFSGPGLGSFPARW